MRKIVAAVSFLFFLLSAHPAHAAFAEAQDPTGDAGDPRADIVAVGANYEDGSIFLALEVPSLGPPGKWNDQAGLAWDVKTDRGTRYVAWYTSTGGTVYEYSPSTLGQKLCDGEQRFSDTAFFLTFPASCVGSPASIVIRGYASYEDKSRGIDAADFAPDESDTFCCQVTEG